MRLAALDYDGFDWDEGNTTKVEARVAIEVVEEKAYEAEIKKIEEN